MANEDVFGTPQYMTPGDMVYTPQAQNTSTTMDKVGDFFNNPAIQTTALQLAAALDPEGFGGRMAKAGLAMRQAQSMAKGLGDTAQGGQVLGTPAAPTVDQPAQVPTPNTSMSNPIDTAKTLTKLGSMVKTAFGISPDQVPDGYSKTLTDALTANPQPVNPTQPVRNSASVPTGVPGSLAPSLSPELAMSMTPEQVAGIFSYGINKERNDIDRTKMNWEMSPERQRERLETAIAPALAQAEAQIKVHQTNHDFDVTKAQQWVVNNPKIASIGLPNGTTVGDWMMMSAQDPDGAKNASQLINAGLDFQASKYAADMHLKAVKISADSQGETNEFYKLTNAFQEYNKQASSKLMSLDEWNAKTPAERQLLTLSGTYPRTPEAEETIRVARTMRDNLGIKLYGPAYQKMIESVKKVDDIVGGGRTVADPTKLKQLEDAKKAKAAALAKQYPNLGKHTPNPVPTSDYVGPMDQMMNIFGPTGGM